MNMRRTSGNRQKLEAWLDNPTTAEDDWMKLTFPEIDRLAGVTERTYDACKVIPKIIADRMGITEQEARQMRNDYRERHGLV